MQWNWKHWNHLTNQEVYDILQLRQAVFIIEQECLYLDADGEDQVCWHLCGYQSNELVAYVRIFPPRNNQTKVVIGRVITAASIRGKGWGRPLMRMAEQKAHEVFDKPHFYLGAQSHLEGFYNSLGYEKCGAEYLEDGIPHLPMIKSPKKI